MGSEHTNKILILAASFVFIVGILFWFALTNLEEQAQRDVSVPLETVLKTTHEAMNLWFTAMERNAKVIARDTFCYLKKTSKKAYFAK